MSCTTTHNYFVYGFFKWYTAWKIRRNFHNVCLTGNFTDQGLPVLLISNHISWWDGFWAMYLNLKVFHRRFYFMMLEDQLKKNRFFFKTGGYPVKKGSKSIIKTLSFTSSLLNDKHNIVLIFPQGEIKSLHDRNIRFGKGLEYVIKKTANRLHIVFLACLTDYFSNPKPGLYLYYMEYTGADFSKAVLEREYNIFHASCIDENINRKEN
ncbi:MAG: lysophospholipid acyltransferase family protein [Bacteroidales bacterium]|jgi:1-acyl-sn-glycerol-3-phosphate acyltransferase|nr:lysophospholipid acyltransferase family protein [Bacteroidales bacterium]